MKEWIRPVCLYLPKAQLFNLRLNFVNFGDIIRFFQGCLRGPQIEIADNGGDPRLNEIHPSNGHPAA